MPRSLFRLLSRLAAVIPLAACEDYGRVTQTVVDPTYRPGELAYAAEGGGIQVLVHGSTADHGRERLTELVLDAFRRSTGGLGTSFTTDAREGQRGVYRVVVAFNPQVQMTDPELCAGQVPASRPAGDELTLRAALCRGGRSLTGAIGVMKNDLARDPRRFDRFLRDVGHALFPSSGTG